MQEDPKFWWKQITMSPYTKIGKRFINKKYDALFN